MPDSRAFIAAGLTYRQLDYWTNAGYLVLDRESAGSGHSRSWPGSELKVARMMASLTKAGFIVKVAHEIARLGPGVNDLSDTVRVVVRERADTPWPETPHQHEP